MKQQYRPLKKKIVKSILVLLVLVGVWNVWKPLPDEINKAWGQRTVKTEDITFLTDTTYTNKQGVRVFDQRIFDTELRMIRNAHTYIFVDMFLWNDFAVVQGDVHRKLSSELTDALIAKKKENKDIVIQVVTDPINMVYGGQPSLDVARMQEAGISVSYTNLQALRDSNPVASSLWRVFIYPLNVLHQKIVGAPYTFRVFPNALDTGGQPVTLRAYLTLLNFKANHRKLLVTDETTAQGKSELVTLITSMNPHDGSSAHSNVAVMLRGPFADDVLASEKRIVELAGGTFVGSPVIHEDKAQGSTVSAELVSDRAILTRIRDVIKDTQKGDTIDILMFYFSERHLIQDLIDASERGVSVRIILDANKDAFGREKNGIPNRQTASTLVTESKGAIKVRWCDTHGEQCHGKMIVVRHGDSYTMMLGSANFTRRNIGGYNLETDVLLTSTSTYQAWSDASSYIEGLWGNTTYTFSLPYESYQDDSRIKKIISWITEQTGLSTF
jgi:phosphatidylserine/phosphatidylglycerophosphate/cardiolipin synthase-like enzyme